MLAFIWMLIIGLIVGTLAKVIMPGSDPGGVFVTMLIGIAGAVMAAANARSSVLGCAAEVLAVHAPTSA